MVYKKVILNTKKKTVSKKINGIHVDTAIKKPVTKKAVKKKTVRKKYKTGKERKPRSDKTLHSQLIHDAFLDLIKRNRGRKPTNNEVAKETGLHPMTVRKYVQEMDFSPQKSLFKVLTDDVIVSIYLSAKKGQSRAQKLWLQIIEGWVEQKNVDIPSIGELNNNLSKAISEKMSDQEAMQIYMDKINGR